MDIKTITVKDFHKYIYENYVLNDLSPKDFLSHRNRIHKLYQGGRFDILYSISKIYGSHSLSDQDNKGNTILHLAAMTSQKSTQQLLSMNADFSIRNVAGDTALHYITRNYDMEFIRSIDKIDSALDIEDNRGYLPIFLAVFKRDACIVELMLKKLEDINHRDMEGNTLLHYACYLEDETIVKLLLENGAFKHEENYEGLMPGDLSNLQNINNLIPNIRGLPTTICSHCNNEARYSYNLPCDHCFCFECLHMLRSSTDPLFVKCSEPSCVDESPCELARLEYNKDVSMGINSIYYYTKYNRIIDNLCQHEKSVSKSFNSLTIYKGFAHINLHKDKEYLIITSTVNTILPTECNRRLKCLKIVSDLNKQPTSFLTGSFYLGKNDLVYNKIHLKLETLDIGFMRSYITGLNQFYMNIVKLISDPKGGSLVAMIAEDVSPYYNYPIDNIFNELKSMHNVIADGRSTLEFISGVTLRAIKNFNTIVLMASIGNIDPDHILSYEYLLRYNLDIPNLQIGIDGTDGEVFISTSNSIGPNTVKEIKKQLPLFNDALRSIRSSIDINCQLKSFR